MSHLQAGDSRAADARALSSPNKVSARENSHYFLKHLLGNIEIYNSLWELSYILRLPGEFTRARHDVKLPVLTLPCERYVQAMRIKSHRYIDT
mmetsp:Transcript_3780/g.12705  ORF Transcript_3780/g.12705 Transcript_3780/m.12705 type:complete len:93 (+) Transcript_3780:493-771(+)